MTTHTCSEFICAQCRQPAMHLHRLPPEINRYICKQVKPIRLVIKQQTGKTITELDPDVPYQCDFNSKDLPADPDVRDDLFYKYTQYHTVHYYIMQGEEEKFSFKVSMYTLWTNLGHKDVEKFGQQAWDFTHDEDVKIILDRGGSEFIGPVLRKQGEYIYFTLQTEYTFRFKYAKYSEVFGKMLYDILARRYALKIKEAEFST